ncbi:MAG: peptide chain release factor-like protein [Minisyncoccia bacterium]
MEKNTNEIDEKIKKLEVEMQAPDFWNDKNSARVVLAELAELKNKKAGAGKYDNGNAIVTIISGAGGDDAEDFSAMLFSMYQKYAKKKGWEVFLIHENKNPNEGYRSVSFEISPLLDKERGQGVRSGEVGPYGILKNESGVHRLVRVSPFDAKKLRHTSFSLVEVLPKFSKLAERDIVLRPEDLKIEFSRSGGPGGQNVNKRETAVRIVHIPTNLSAHASTERSQEQNREIALDILRAKIFKKTQNEKKSVEEIFKQKSTEIEWGSQIRSYVLHPYKMVKDHRTGAETSNIDAVLAGDLDMFIEAEKNL